MRRLLLVALALCSVTVSASSYIAFEQITVAAASIGFTAAKITPPGLPQATSAVCRLETAEIRYTLDGTTPSTTVGTPMEALETLTFTGQDVLAKFRAIRTTGVSGQLDCHYFAP